MDDPKYVGRRQFKKYQQEIQYQFNSRGFRDSEWPSDLASAVWCIGDSFTLGVGVPEHNTWPRLLQTRLGKRCVNLGFEGASNQWIARRAVAVLQQVCPQIMVIHWSFVHRREYDYQELLNQRWKNHYQQIRAREWPACPEIQDFATLPQQIQNEILNEHSMSWQEFDDEDRRIHYSRCTDQQDIDNLLECVDRVTLVAGNTVIVHSAIPVFVPQGQAHSVDSAMSQRDILWVGAVTQRDHGRDQFHYDRITAEYLVNDIQQALNGKTNIDHGPARSR
jgi:hypothetical protein